MGTQNSGSLSLNKAAEIAAKERELTCAELEAANKEAREKETNSSFKGGAHTTAYRKDAAGNGKYIRAMCPNLPKAEFAEPYDNTVTDKNQPPCAGGRPTSKGRRNDAENKILVPEMKAQKGGKILMSTWHTGGANGEDPDAMPCYSCRQAICEAEKCGIEVWLCKAQKKPPDAVRPKDKGLCPPAKGQGDFDTAWRDAGLGMY